MRIMLAVRLTPGTLPCEHWKVPLPVRIPGWLFAGRSDVGSRVNNAICLMDLYGELIVMFETDGSQYLIIRECAGGKKLA